MLHYEYKVVPAPVKGQRGKGVKGGPGRFALALETMMNDLAAEGWEYLRADTLPSEERSGLTGSTTVFQNMLVFRREIAAAMAMPPLREAAASVAEDGVQPEDATTSPAAPVLRLDPARESGKEPVAGEEKAPPRLAKAAAAAAAALSAYRGTRSPSNAPKLGPAVRRDERDDDEEDDVAAT